MAEFVLLAIVVIVMSIIGQIKKAQRKGQTRFKVPTPKSWQLPGPGQLPPPGQPLGQQGRGQQYGQFGRQQYGGQPVGGQQYQFPPGTPPQLIQLIQRLPGAPQPPQQLIQPMPGVRPFQPQVVQPMAGNVPPPAPAGWVPPYTAPPPGYGQPGFAPSGFAPAGFAPAGFAPNQPQQQRPPHHRPPQNNLPAQQGSLDDRVRKLMNANNEVNAVRLLCEEADLGIIEAQRYARSLVAPKVAKPAADAPDTPATDGEERWSGSAAFGTSTFERDDENVWASGWVDEPDEDDRSDITELWDSVRNAGRPPQS